MLFHCTKFIAQHELSPSSLNLDSTSEYRCWPVMLCQPGQAQSRSTQPGLKLSHMTPLYSGYNTLTFSPFCYHTWCWRVLSYTPNLLSILPRMEPDNTEYYQPSYQPSYQPVAQPSPTESVWTIPTLPSGLQTHLLMHPLLQHKACKAEQITSKRMPR